MKKLFCCLLSVMLIVLTIAPMTAAENENVTEDDGVYTVAVADGSDVVLPDAPDADEIAELDSYELIIEEEPVLVVEQSNVPDPATGTTNNGYFSADFMIPDTTRTVFLAGLSAEKVEEVQNLIIASYIEGEDFELTELSFIDAEKTRNKDDDDLLCWAAAASNILTYTGWAARAGFSSSDDLFEAYIDAFTNKGGSAYFGVGWFFNGVNTFAVLDSTAASATKGSGGFLKQYYAYDMLCSDYYIDDPVTGLSTMFRRLREGCGIALGLDVYYDGDEAGGHADTCWGYIADTAYEPTDMDYYIGLFISDSDSDEQTDIDRRDAPNILQMTNILFGEYTDGSMYCGVNLDQHNFAIIDSYTWLLPYSSKLPREHDLNTSRDKTKTTDISIKEAYLGTDFQTDNFTVRMDKIESNTRFYYTPRISNESDINYSGKNTDLTITCYDADGNEVFTYNTNVNLSLNVNYYLTYNRSIYRREGLPEGDYTMTMSVNKNHNVAEAYYYNNTYTFSFKVRDSFKLGDTDGDGFVNITDATKIQRILAFYDEGVDAKMLERASIIGEKLSIVDATIIQRYLLNYNIPQSVGEKELYE